MAYTDYAAVVADNAQLLVAQLQERIAAGWQPYGSPVSITEGFQVLQAIVKGSADGGEGAGAVSSESISDASVIGKTLLTAADKAAALAAIGAGTSSFSGSFNDLNDKPAIPAAAAVGDAAKLQTGTETVSCTWTAKVLHDEVARQIAAIAKK